MGRKPINPDMTAHRGHRGQRGSRGSFWTIHRTHQLNGSRRQRMRERRRTCCGWLMARCCCQGPPADNPVRRMRSLAARHCSLAMLMQPMHALLQQLSGMNLFMFYGGPRFELPHAPRHYQNSIQIQADNLKFNYYERNHGGDRRRNTFFMQYVRQHKLCSLPQGGSAF